MHRLAVLALAMALVPAPISAQHRPIAGVYGGINFAKFGGDDVGNVDTRTGVQAGLFASFPLSSILAVQPGVAYSQEGTSVDAGGGITGTFKLDYIQVPVLLKLSAPLQANSNLRPYVVAGPALGFEVRCKVRAEVSGQSAEADCDNSSVNFQTKSVLFGLHLGAGLEISRLFLGLRYQLGLTSIDDSGANADVKNRVLAIVAGYGFRLGR
jgi:hypothetical protein